MKRLVPAVLFMLFLVFPAFSLNFDSLPNHQDEGMKLYIRGTGKLQEKNYVAAVNDLKRAVKLRPDLSEAFHNLGYAFERIGDLQNAAKAYERALKLKPDYPSALNNLGFLLATTESNTDKAVELCRRAVDLKPKSANFRDSFGWALYKDGKIHQAAEHFKAAIQLDRNFYKPYFNLGLVEFTRDNYSQAAKLFKNVIKLNRNYLKAYVSLGDCYEKLGQENQALYVYRQSLAIAPDSQPIKKHLKKKVSSLSNESRKYYFNNVKKIQGSSKLREFLNRKSRGNSMASNYSASSSPIESNGSYTAVSAKNSDIVNSHSANSDSQTEQGGYNELKNMVRASKPIRRENSYDTDTLSSSYSASSVYPVKNQRRRQLTVKQERMLERKYSLSNSYLDRGLIEEAAKELEQIIQKAPQSSSVHRQARSLLLKIKKKQEEKAEQKALTHIDMGKDFFRSGQYETAENEFFKALSLDPENAEVHKDLALLYYNQGKLKQAYEESKKAIALDKTLKEAYVVLGSLYAKKGRTQDALRTLKKVNQVSHRKDAVDELAGRMIAELSSEY
ncbi:MAG: tetratricopeptide repeat protein [Candidatus Rifleibacteriota bacterium]